MSRRHFSLLVVLAVVATLVAVFLPRPAGDVDTFESAPLLPAFAEQANTIDWLRVTGAGGEVVATLERGAERWTVAEAGGYAADWGVLRPLLAGLADARVLEPKTSNPQYYDRLGVEDVAADDAQGMLIEFRAGSGLPALILGKPAQGRDGQYARLAGEAGSVLIDRDLDVPKQRENWLDRAIVDVAEGEVVEVGIVHADGDTVVARKVSADDADFVLEGVAEGFEPRSAWTVNSLAGGLSSLRLDAVAPEQEIDWTGATRFRVLTADGLNVEAELVAAPSGEDGGATERWLRLSAGLYTTGLDTGVEAGGDDAAVRERADAINRRVAGWAYRVPDYKASTMDKRMADLVQAVAGDGDA